MTNPVTITVLFPNLCGEEPEMPPHATREQLEEYGIDYFTYLTLKGLTSVKLTFENGMDVFSNPTYESSTPDNINVVKYLLYTGIRCYAGIHPGVARDNCTPEMAAYAITSASKGKVRVELAGKVIGELDFSEDADEYDEDEAVEDGVVMFKAPEQDVKY